MKKTSNELGIDVLLDLSKRPFDQRIDLDHAC